MSHKEISFSEFEDLEETLLENLNEESFYGDPFDFVLEDETQRMVHELIDVLPKEKYRDVIRMRFMDDMTLRSVGEVYSKSTERIRQIEAKALRMLRHPSRSAVLKDLYLEEETLPVKKEAVIPDPCELRGYQLDSYKAAKRFYDGVQNKNNVVSSVVTHNQHLDTIVPYVRGSHLVRSRHKPNIGLLISMCVGDK